MPKILPPSIENIALTAQALIGGATVIFPTETVYGLGGNAYNDNTVYEIFRRKGRPADKPLSVCYPDLARAKDDIDGNDIVLALMEKFLPGPVTFVLECRQSVRLSSLCLAGGHTVGIRIPANKIALSLLKLLPFPLATTSANKSGKPSPITAQQAAKELHDEKNLIILDGGECAVGVESTVVDLIERRVLRSGAIPAEQIEALL
ncbi:MAG: threonylcarbamoyl-AMP synthase [Holosporaceae bacterium]|jgi:L-threonylcarbamoyladenylate synthase|nr:threonylcarbamoyl-AMP synthase [Holosporaceae bacterium]